MEKENVCVCVCVCVCTRVCMELPEYESLYFVNNILIKASG